VIGIVREFVIHPDKNKKSGHHAYRQTGKLDKACHLVFSYMTPSGLKVVFPHIFNSPYSRWLIVQRLYTLIPCQ